MLRKLAAGVAMTLLVPILVHALYDFLALLLLLRPRRAASPPP